MERAHLKAATASEWVIGFADRFAMESAQRSQSFIAEALARLAGRPVDIRFVQETRLPSDDGEIVASPVDEEAMAAAAKNEKVQKVLNVFKGKIRAPEPTD
jgi:hypothetical protein